MSELSDFLNKPLSIGGRTIDRRLVLAPMAMLGHVAFRELLAELGGVGLMFSEMCSAKRLPYENRQASTYFRWRDCEREHLVFQIVGNEPDWMARAARRIEQEGFFGVDINFGCAAKTICHQKGGAAVLKDPDLAEEIVSAVRRAVRIPVFVKYRIGWKDDPVPAVDLARRFEDAGADALTFHARVAPDRRSQRPKWRYIGKVKTAVDIPVFGNGDVFTPTDCLKMIQLTGCDGVAIGRMAIARPWLFAQWTGNEISETNPFHQTATRLAELLEKHYDPPAALRRFRKFAYYYSANFRFGHRFHTRIINAESMTVVKARLDAFFSSSPSLCTRPNMNFFM